MANFVHLTHGGGINLDSVVEYRLPKKGSSIALRFIGMGQNDESFDGEDARRLAAAIGCDLREPRESPAVH